MTKRGNAGVRVAAALVLAVLLAVGCSSSDDVATTETTAETASTTTTAAGAGGPKVTEVRQSCSADTLGAAAVASFAAPQLVDVTCEDKFATATLVNGPGGENVVLFGLQGGTWVLVGNAPIADAAGAAPADFSPTAVPAWQRTRDARLNRAARPAGGVPSTPSTSIRTNEDGNLEVCVQEHADALVCLAPSTLPEPVIPEDPNAPPTTVKQSGFCKYNYNDPRCVADPGFVP